MFRRSSPPRPQPANPSAAMTDANHLSAQIQQLLAMILPEPVVTVLAALSDLLYRAVLGKPNDNIYLYTCATFIAPVGHLLVIYARLSNSQVFFSFIIFSVKWFVILAALAFIVAYSLGNGNIEQGARVAAERGGLDLRNSGGWFDAIRKSPASQQVAPYLSQAGNNLGGMAAALPYMQGFSQQMFGMMQGTRESAASAPRDRNIREYRDVRPKKKRYSFGAGDNNAGGAAAGGPSNLGGGRSSAFANDEAREKSKRSSPTSRLARFSRRLNNGAYR